MASTTELPASSEPETRKEINDSVPPYSSLEVKTPKFNCPSFSELLEGVVMAANSASSHQANPLVVENVRFEGQFKMSHQEALACVTEKATKAQVQAQMHLLTEPANSSDTSPSTQPELATPTSSNIAQNPSPSLPENKANNTCEGDKKSSSSYSSQEQSLLLPENKASDTCQGDKGSSMSYVTRPPTDIAKAPNSDGYSWRKYGQKQVKSPESSRSYYRCTYADCNAKKKVQHSDKSGCIIGVDYKGQHNHDPPRQIQRINKGKSLKKQIMTTESVAMVNAGVSYEKRLGDVDKSSSDEEHELAVSLINGSERNALNNSVELKGGDVGEEHQKTANQIKRPEAEQLVLLAGDECSRLNDFNDHFMKDAAKERDVVSGQKKRMKERGKACFETPQRAPKQPKIVIHAAGEVGILSDGYRWRKYGQKMVKGNPHPRSYYRCTSAGCPVRKHVERAIDNSTAIIVTYEGKHDHNMPVPKKRPSSSSSTTSASSLIVATTAANNITLHQMESTHPSQVPLTRWQVDGDGDSRSRENKSSELGAEKMLESARTLLSIGIELKSC